MTERTPRKANAPRQRGEGANEKLQGSEIIADMRDRIKERVQLGEVVAATDFSEVERPAYWAAIAVLCDEIPIRTGWRTIAEDHVDGHRLRERVYRLRVRGHVDMVLAGWLCVAAVALGLAVRGVLA